MPLINDNYRTTIQAEVETIILERVAAIVGCVFTIDEAISGAGFTRNFSSDEYSLG